MKIIDDNSSVTDPQFTYTMPCDTKTVCADGKDQDTDLVGYYIDRSSIFYIDNWVEQLNIACMPAAYIGLMGAAAFGGAAISCFFVP